jgi:hypothetical protein
VVSGSPVAAGEVSIVPPSRPPGVEGEAPMAQVVFQDVVKRFGETTVIPGLNLAVR